MNDLTILSGSSNEPLSRRIVDELRIDLGHVLLNRFSDGEVNVEIVDNVRGRDVFIVQSTCAPTNDNLMELLIMADAVRRGSAHRITAVLPYFGYARQDKRVRSARVPISAKVVADMMGVGGRSAGTRFAGVLPREEWVRSSRRCRTALIGWSR